MSAGFKISSLTSYVTDRKPNFYGGQQQEYLELAEKAIESGVAFIADEIEKKTDPAQIYHRIKKVLQNALHGIA